MNTNKTLKIKNNHLTVGGVDTLKLVKEYGTPLYVFDTAYIENMCSTYVNAMQKYYGKGIVSYASKAFSCLEIYRLISKFNMFTDVVSIGELYTALKAGFKPENIIFHGNNKTKEELEFAIINKVKSIVVDAESEIDDIQYFASLNNVKQSVLLRVNPGIEAHTHHYIQTASLDSKFGFLIGNRAESVIKKILSCKNLGLEGLHCHIGSQIFEEKSFVLAVEKMCKFYSEIKAKFNIDFNVLNLGGGFGIYYAEGDKIFSNKDYESFIEQISLTLNNKIKEYGLVKPTLIIEPGRSIVGEAGLTLYTVGRIKQVNNNLNYLAVDGGMSDNPRYALYQAKYSCDLANRISDKKDTKYTVVGKCCESGDVLIVDAKLPKVNEGDVLAVYSTGAYNYSMSSNYNGNAIPQVVFVKDGEVKLAVKKQTLDDLIRNNI